MLNQKVRKNLAHDKMCTRFCKVSEVNGQQWWELMDQGFAVFLFGLDKYTFRRGASQKRGRLFLLFGELQLQLLRSLGCNIVQCKRFRYA